MSGGFAWSKRHVWKKSSRSAPDALSFLLFQFMGKDSVPCFEVMSTVAADEDTAHRAPCGQLETPKSQRVERVA